MFHQLIRRVGSMFIFLISSPMFAHEGHDHSHWSSPLLHFLFYTVIFAIAAGLVYAIYKSIEKLVSSKQGLRT